MTLCRHAFAEVTHSVTNVWNWRPGDCSHGLPAAGAWGIGPGSKVWTKANARAGSKVWTRANNRPGW